MKNVCLDNVQIELEVKRTLPISEIVIFLFIVQEWLAQFGEIRIVDILSKPFAL